MIYYVANWKSNKSPEEVKQWFESAAQSDQGSSEIVCVPFPFIQMCHELITANNLAIKLGAQDISPFPFGAYTGAVSVGMIKNWVDYVIIGHSERRQYFHESNQDIANKALLLVEANITPIVCVDEPYAQTQITALDSEVRQKCLYAYEPVSAIGSGIPDTPQHANQVAEMIWQECGSEVPVLYGGSVKAENVGLFLNQTAIQGVLVGGASLDPQQWQELTKLK